MKTYHVHVVVVKGEYEFNIRAADETTARSKALKKKLTAKNMLPVSCGKLAITFN